MSKLITTLVGPLTGRVTITKLQILTRVFTLGGELAKVLIVSFGLLTFVQLIYPPQLARPFAISSYGRVGFKTRQSVVNQIHKLNSTPVVIKLENLTYTEQPSRIGISVEPQKAANQAVNYGLMERLKPFSLFNRRDLYFDKEIDSHKLDEFVQKAIEENKRPAKNAKLSQDANGNYRVQSGEVGTEYHSQELKEAIVAMAFGKNVQVAIKGSPVDPPITEQELKAVVVKADAAARLGMVVILGGESHSIPSNLLKDWVHVSANEANGTVSLSYDRKSIATWVQSKSSHYYLSATPTVTKLVDGKTVETRPGKAGQQVDIEQSVKAITDSLDKGSFLAQGVIKPVSPSAQISRGYSATSYGLQLLINDWAHEQGRVQVGVVLREMGGQGRQASINAGQSFFTASFYKLFVAHYLLSKIMSGQLNPNTQLQGGRSIITCAEVMIVNSDNPCPEAAAAVFGWSQLHAFARAAGFGSTTLAAGNIRTTAADTADYMTRLYQGSLLGSYTGTMQGWMQRQIYRSAIPAGAKGSTVADKVGFYNGSWHDAAIVSGPKTTYVLVVMTEGVGPGPIATLTQRIQATFGQ